MQLQGKVAAITGASRGIGKALAFALGKRGCHLLLTGLERRELEDVARTLETAHGRAVPWLALDLVEADGAPAFIEWVRSRDPPLDILVNNAGAGQFASFAGSAWSDAERTLLLDALVPTRLIHGLLPILRRRPEAAIVNVSSASARVPYCGLAVYGASKSYLSSLSDTLAAELSGTGVRVLCIHPGFTRTQFLTSAAMDMSRIPDWFMHEPEDVADRIVGMLEGDKAWAYGDLATQAGLAVAAALPHKARARVFKNLFWRLPDEA
jgi:short-subunit dehydrogenase